MLDEREVHERTATAFRALRDEILAFMAKEGLRAPPREGPPNIDSTLHCLRHVLEWAHDVNAAYESPDSDRWP